jgi:hypothetical protein
MPRKQPSRAQDADSGDEADNRILRTLAQQLRTIQEDVATAKSEAAEAKASNAVLRRQLGKQRLSSGKIVLKSRGNQAQYDANVEILNELIRSLTALEEGEDGEIEESIRTAIKAINARNKLIKLADNSAVGWSFVDEYLRNDSAVDEEDDRHIKRCEAAAVEKRRLRQEAGNRGRGSKGRGRHQNAQTARQPQRVEHSEGYAQADYHDYEPQYYSHSPEYYYPRRQTQEAPVYQAPSRYYQQPQPHYAAAQQRAAPYYRQLGPCFKCGGPHMVRHCPENDRVTADVQNQIEEEYYQ